MPSCRKCSLPETKKGTKIMSGCGIFLIVLGITLFIVAGTVPAWITETVDNGLIDAVVLDDQYSQSHPTWTNNSKTPVIMTLYVLDIANPREILEDGASPVLIERGPYVYIENVIKYNLTWTDDGEKLSWHQWEQFTFDRANSIEDDRDRIVTTVNVPFISIARAVLAPGARGDHEADRAAREIIQALYKPSDAPFTDQELLFQKRSVRELIWGYDHDPFLFRVADLIGVSDRWKGFFQNWTSPAEADAQDPPQNRYEMMTGKNNLNKIRYFTKWKDMDSLRVCQPGGLGASCVKEYAWGTPEASQIRGCDGSQYPPRMDKGKKYPVFYGNIFRTIDMEYTEEVKYKGINLWRYKIPRSAWLSAANNPANAAFYHFTPDGLYNITSMTQRAPLFISKPHFVEVDPSVRDRVNAIWQDEQEWDTFFDIEPISGAAFHVDSATQINIEIIPLTDMINPDSGNASTWFPKIGKPLYMPIFWAKQEDGIDDESAKKFINKVYTAIFIGDAAYYGGWTFGPIFLVGGLVMAIVGFIRLRRMNSGAHHSEHTNLLPTSDSASAFVTSAEPENARSDPELGRHGVGAADAEPVGLDSAHRQEPVIHNSSGSNAVSISGASNSMSNMGRSESGTYQAGSSSSSDPPVR